MSFKRLFHYTSINNLALILASRNIRFSRLDKVNDPSEGISSDFGSLAVYKFISSWTKNSEENFALWNMYTDKMRGIRLELPLPIFNNYKIGETSNLLVSEADYIDYEKEIFIITAQNKPIGVEYTDDEEQLFPKIRGIRGLKASSLGVKKRTIWRIEDEVRFIMDILPIDSSTPKNNLPNTYQKKIANKIPPKIYFYDIAMNEESFKNMKILIGPRIKLGDREIVNALVNKFNPSATVQISKLTDKIK